MKRPAVVAPAKEREEEESFGEDAGQTSQLHPIAEELAITQSRLVTGGKGERGFSQRCNTL